jgi:hypothetical protein
VNGLIIFHLPDDTAKVSTSIEMDVQGLRAAWKSTLQVDCPCCGGTHEMSVRDTYVDAALRDATDRSRRAI